MVAVPAKADDPKRLRPKRAPASAAKSRRRTVMGGLPLYSSAMGRRTANAPMTPRQRSSQPPLGTESRWLPRMRVLSEAPASVVQLLPAASRGFSRGGVRSFDWNHSRALSHMGVQATRCAPCSSAVRARNSLSSSIAAFASTGMSHRLLRSMIRLAADHLSAARLPDKDSIAYLDLAAHGDDGRTALDGKAFKSVVVIIRVLRGGGDGAAILGVVDDQIGVRSNGDGALAREEAEELGCAGAERVDEAVKAEPAALYAVGVHQIDAIFKAGNAVRNLGESLRAEELLLRVEGTVVRANRVDQAGFKSAPQDWEIGLVAQGQTRR